MIIAQLSDLHIMPNGALAYDAADTLAALGNMVDHLNRMRPAPSLVIITGDIADDGSPGSYETARQALDTLEIPFYLVPGNHDHKDRLSGAFPDHTYLTRAMEKNRGHHMSYALALPSLLLIGLDTVIPGMHGGGMDDHRLGWLDRRLSRHPKTPTILFMHHPPFPSGIRHMDRDNFSGTARFAGVIRRHPQVRHLACGHIHRAIFTRFAGTPATVCPGTGMQLALDLAPEAPSGFVMEPAAAMLHTIMTDWNNQCQILTHVSLVQSAHDRYGVFHPFF